MKLSFQPPKLAHLGLMFKHKQFDSNYLTKHIFSQKYIYGNTISGIVKPPRLLFPKNHKTSVHLVNPDFTAISGPIHTKTPFNPQINTQIIQTAPTHGYGCTMAKKIFPIIRSHVLGPIQRPLTASFNRNISQTFKMGIKPK